MQKPWMAAFAAALFLVGCGRKEVRKPEGAGNPATAPLDYLAAQGRAKQVAIKVTSTAEITSAIQKFQAMEDRFPKDLNELVQQHYLQSVPQAPRGQKFAYNAQDGSVRVVAEPAAAAPGSPGK
ncbi:MAG: hypothetical protein JNL10_03030 [Verrucomicrobiales bacterium]|nr:hypothetical protein [Verrucomicrobiales bacterium]